MLNFLRQDDCDLLHASQAHDQLLKLFSLRIAKRQRRGWPNWGPPPSATRASSYPRSEMEATLSGYLPEQILVKVDRASMRSALECRAPFLDSDLFDFVNQLPLQYSFARGQGKALLRKALPAWVPPEIRWRQKQGFTPPLAAWLRNELRGRVENDLGEFSQEVAIGPRSRAGPSTLRPALAGEDGSDQLFRWIVLIRRCTQL